MKCPTCSFAWDRLDICPTLPVHDCKAFQGENPPAKTQSEILLSYLAENQPLTIGRLVSESGCGCLDRGYETIKRLITEGKIRRDESVVPEELWVV